MSASTQPRRWASIDTGAEHVDMSNKTIRRMIATGTIGGYRFGKKTLRIDLNELDAVARPIPNAAALAGGAA